MKILIFGASGYAGKAIKEKLSDVYEVYGTYCSNYREDDEKMYQYTLGNEERLEEILLQVQPEMVISCMRGDFELQKKMHEKVAMYLKETGGKLIFFSTSNAFDAKLEKVHYETEEPEAKTDYGQFKVACEKKMLEILGEQLVILRIPQIWGKNCPRIIKLVEDIKTHTPIMTYQNLFMNVTLDVQIAEWMEEIIKEKLSGVVHVGTKDVCDYKKFYLDVISALGLEGAIIKEERLEEPCYQAVLPGREEVKEELQWSVIQVIEYLREVHREESGR